jgi:hypothetical protein
MSMTVREPVVAWSLAWSEGIVGAVLGGAMAVRSWRRTRRAIRLARDSGDQMEVIARLRLAIRQAG